MKVNRVRIIGGTWRSRLINFPDSAALRPTPDRVRETLFNWLAPDINGARCLDLFAGSGALGFEAASRGASEVLMVERERTVCAALETNCTALAASQVKIVRADAVDFLRGTQGAQGVYDVVFLDPPFDHVAGALWETLFDLLPNRLAPQAVVYRESGSNNPPPPGWTVYKQGRAGQVNYQLLKLQIT